MRRRLRRALGVVGVGLLLLSAGAVVEVAAATHAPAAAPLPATRLEFGLSNLDTTWMTGSGVPWRYRYQYLAGGVNTSNNWLTWQDLSLPPGQFALDFMTNSTTPPANYIPVFTWYELLQSTPSTGSSELDRDYNNLNNAATMSSYYSSFKVLMQKAGQYGRQVVVHVEPDFWGYMQQKAAGGDATTVSASVKSSGFAEVSAYADTVAGFAAALQHLRDTYAPNALLAIHASMWSSGIDVASNTDPNVNAPGEADKTAAFLNSASGGGWDAVFNDVDDHDAAWWELASCGTPPCVNQYFTHWWDASNVKFPNFSRYLSWVAELHARTARPQIVWQVPVGNQYFLTMNNTCGHYQDNVAPYFIGHPDQLFNAGLVAVLFGKGNDCQTTNDDTGPQDGVTNNGGTPTSDVLGGCDACNTHTSTWADNDGGYLRTFVGQYYSGQSTACSAVNVSVVPSSPRAAGTGVTVTASAAGCAHPLYHFSLLAPGPSSYTLAQAYSTSNTYAWATSGLVPGTYRFSVWARDSGSAGLYGNSDGRWDAYNNGTTYMLTGCAAVAVGTTPGSPAEVGGTVTVSATASGCSSPRYRFALLAPGSSTYTQAQAYSTSNTYAWSTTGLVPGTYRFSVWAEDASSGGGFGNADGRWDAYNNNTTFTLTGCGAVSVSVSPASPAVRGTAVTVTASGSGCSSPRYHFSVLAPGSSTYVLAQAYSSSPTYTWNTTGLAAGQYRFSVWVEDASSGGAYGNSDGRWDAYNNNTVFTLS